MVFGYQELFFLFFLDIHTAMDHLFCNHCRRGCPCTRGGISRTLGRTTGLCKNRQTQLLPVFHSQQQHEQPSPHLPPMAPPQQLCPHTMLVPESQPSSLISDCTKKRKRKALRPMKNPSSCKKARELPPPPLILVEKKEDQCGTPDMLLMARGRVGANLLELLDTKMTQPFSHQPAVAETQSQ